MAKTGFWLKGSQGKLAGATMYKDGASGETIIREVVTPSNPKTTAQNIQRIIMLTVGQAYSLLKEICDHSFEGVAKGRETMAYFMKQNIQFCREKLAAMQQEGVDYADMYNFLPLGSKGFVPNQYQIAMGSLPRVDCALFDDAYTKAFVQGIPANATYQDVIDTLGLQRGDQLTFMYLRGNATFQNDIQFEFSRVILDPTNADYSQAPLSTPFIVDGNINLPSVRNEGNFRFTINEHGLGFESRKVTGGASKPCVAACVIVSRKVGDNWNRSTTYLTYLPNYNAYSMGDCLQRAAEGVSAPLYSANPLYLNNAGEGGGAAAEAGQESGGGSSQGGGSTPSASVTGVSVDGSPVIQGTKKLITLAEGASFPAAINIAAQTSGLNGKQMVIMSTGADPEVLDSTTIANNAASATFNAAKDVTYKIAFLDEEDEVAVATDYTFEVTSGSDED